MLEGLPGRLAGAAIGVSVTLATLVACGGMSGAAAPDSVGAVAFQKRTNQAQSLRQTDFSLARRSGAEHSRVNVSWRGIDNTRRGLPNLPDRFDGRSCTTAAYDWCALDRLLAGYRSIGLPVHPVLIGTPEWANTSDCNVGRGAVACHPAPLALEDWRLFVTSAVRRYGPNGTFWNRIRAPAKFDMHVWEVWNEPDHRLFWDGSGRDAPAADAQQYAQLVTTTNDGVERAASPARPSARIAGPSVSSFNPDRPGGWLRTFAARDARLSFDVVSGHLYGATAERVIAQVDAYRRLFPGRPMWLTENGFGSGRGCRHCAGGVAAQRAEFRQLMDRLGVRTYVESFTWFMGARHPAFGGTHGLFRDNGRPKPVLRAFKAAG